MLNGISVCLWAQNATITAKVLDSASRQPLGFASVGIKGAPFGTITNEQGEFDFHFPLEYRNETLVISMLGYSSFEAPIMSLLTNTEHTILLSKSPILLREIVVSDTLTGGDILRIALSRIEQNYPMDPFLLDGFYRDVKKVGGMYISLLEAAVKIYDDNYAEPRNKYRLRERVRLVEVRRSLGYESKFTSFFDQSNLLEDLLLHNNIRYRQIETSDWLFAAMKREEGSYYEGHEIYVVSYGGGPYKLLVYIDKEDFSIIRFEYEMGASPERLQRKGKVVSRFAGLKKTIGFRRYAGKMYPSYMTMTSKVNWYDFQTNELRFETELIQELLINQVNPHPTERVSSTEKMRNYGLQYQDQPYNKAFWDNYNVIKETPLNKQIIADLEQQVPLERQFQGN